MGWDADLQESLDDLFVLAGVQATYSRGEDFAPVRALFRELTVDDVVSEQVVADAVICQIREAEIHADPFNRQPRRGDTISRELPAGADGGPRQQELLVAAPPARDASGTWRLTCQQNIRIVPR